MQAGACSDRATWACDVRQVVSRCDTVLLVAVTTAVKMTVRSAGGGCRAGPHASRLATRQPGNVSEAASDVVSQSDQQVLKTILKAEPEARWVAGTAGASAPTAGRTYLSGGHQLPVRRDPWACRVVAKEQISNDPVPSLGRIVRFEGEKCLAGNWLPYRLP
jgi:hypothetical protein